MATKRKASSMLEKVHIPYFTLDDRYASVVSHHTITIVGFLHFNICYSEVFIFVEFRLMTIILSHNWELLCIYASLQQFVESGYIGSFVVEKFPSE